MGDSALYFFTIYLFLGFCCIVVALSLAREREIE